MDRKLLCLMSVFLLGAVGCGGGNTSSVNDGYLKSAPVEPGSVGPAGAGPSGNAGAAAEPPPPPVP